MTTSTERPESDAPRSRARVRDWLFWIAGAVFAAGQAYGLYLALTHRKLVGHDAIAATPYSIKTLINIVAVSRVEHTLFTFWMTGAVILIAVVVLLGMVEWEDRRNSARRAKLGDGRP